MHHGSLLTRHRNRKGVHAKKIFVKKEHSHGAHSRHPATLTRSERVAHGFQAACDFWRKLWQVTSLPGLSPPAPQEQLSHPSVCVSSHGTTLQAGSLSPQPSLHRTAVGHPLHNCLSHSKHKPSVCVLVSRHPQDGLPAEPSFQAKRPSLECSTICQTQGPKRTAWWGDETHELGGHAGPEGRPGLGTPSALTPLQEAPRPLSPWQSLEHPAETGSGSTCVPSDP